MSSIKITKIGKSSIDTVDFDNIPFGKIFTDHMFVADYDDGKWDNFEIRPMTRFMMHPGNITLHYGQAIFEGMKASVHQDGTPMLFRPELHSDRINASAARLCMPDFPKDVFMDALHQLVGLESDWIPKAEGSALYLRPFMIAMDEFIGVHSSAKYRFFILCLPVGPYYSNPVSLKVEQEYVRAVPGGMGEAKAAGNYAASLYPSKLAKEQGYDQIMWMGGPEMKQIQEVGTMNIFFKIGHKVYTPKINGAILKGITRMTIMEYMTSEGVEVIEKDLTIDEIVAAYDQGELKEVFGSGTAAIVAPVKRIGYQGRDLDIDPSKFTLAPKIKSYINGLRSGAVDDKFGWTVPVNSLETV